MLEAAAAAAAVINEDLLGLLLLLLSPEQCAADADADAEEVEVLTGVIGGTIKDEDDLLDPSVLRVFADEHEDC